MSLSGGATNKAGNSRVVIKNVANEPVSLSFSSNAPSLVIKNPGIPICACSCANTIASSRWSWLVKKRVQNERTEDGEDKSHFSEKIFSLEVVERKSDIKMVIFGESMGSGERTMIWAPRCARF
jgi:hypothetical protein